MNKKTQKRNKIEQVNTLQSNASAFYDCDHDYDDDKLYELQVDSIDGFNATLHDIEQNLRLNPTKENIELLEDMCKMNNIRVKIYDDYSCRYWLRNWND